jgi:hypothetical protein
MEIFVVNFAARFTTRTLLAMYKSRELFCGLARERRGEHNERIATIALGVSKLYIYRPFIIYNLIYLSDLKIPVQ